MSLAEVTTTPAGIQVVANNIRDDNPDGGERKLLAEFDRPSEAHIYAIKGLVRWKDEANGARISVDMCLFNIFPNNAPQEMQTVLAHEPIRNGLPEKVIIRYSVAGNLHIEELKLMFVTSWAEYENSDFAKRIKAVEDSVGDVPCPMCKTVALVPFISDLWSCAMCGNYGAGECKSCSTCNVNVCKTCCFQIGSSEAQSGASKFREVSVIVVESQEPQHVIDQQQPEQQQPEKP
eukprot:PhF_6_TR5296/c0_g1_i1/m.7683